MLTLFLVISLFGSEFNVQLLVNANLDDQRMLTREVAEEESWSIPTGSREKIWNFNSVNEWIDFAKVDGGSGEIVIGVNHAKSNSYEKLKHFITENHGELVNTVLINGEVRAAVADVPLRILSSFAEETQAAEISRYIEPNIRFQTTFTPNDPCWNYQWGPAKIQADYAWNTTTGDPSVLVAIIDTGIDWNHPDLAANYVALGYDWVNNDTDPMDDNGHGTHCAGIIAATLNNSVGIAGLAQVRIMAEKGLDASGMGYTDDLVNAIIHAVDCGADIISCSWGGYFDSRLMHDAMRYAYDHGVLVVAAAGNIPYSIKNYPAAYEEVVAVTATDEDDTPAYFTSYGEWVELAAPGVDIYSTVWDNSYAYMSGTSMACPHVAGVAALIWSQFPNLTRDQLRVQLWYTSDDLGDPSFDIYYGYGRVNARRAVEEALPDHDLLVLDWQTPPYVEPGSEGTTSTTVFNFGESNETNITVQLLANGTVVDDATVSFLASGASATVNCLWIPAIEGLYNITSYVVPVQGEILTEYNVVWTYVRVGFPLKAFVIDSYGTDDPFIWETWDHLNANWTIYGDTMIYIDYTMLNKDNITYHDIVATDADVLIISCACYWELTDSEIEAITQYVHEGHGLIATAGTLCYTTPNNNKLAPLFGLSKIITWDATSTAELNILNPTHPLFVNISNPYFFGPVGTAVPEDEEWNRNELAGGTYIALGSHLESAIVVYKGLAYISPFLEGKLPYEGAPHLQLFYNAITWSCYEKQEHDLVASLEYPPHLKPGQSTVLNATVSNMGEKNETNVELYLLINGAVVRNTTIPKLQAGDSHTINYSWAAPSAEVMYNVTAYAPPVPKENFTEDNRDTKFTRVTNALVIGIIVTHGETLYSEDLPKYYRSLSYIVEKIFKKITPDLLNAYDLVIVGQWYETWLPSEIAAVKAYINSGGGFVAIGHALSDSVQEILAEYGISYTGLKAKAGYSCYFDPLHPIMCGVNLIFVSPWPPTWPPTRTEFIAYNSLNVTNPAYYVANDVSNKHIVIAGAEVGGHVLCMSTVFAYHVYYGDNKIMFKNIIDWMTGKYEHELIMKLEAPDILQLGCSTLLNATVFNYGANNETDVRLQLLIEGTEVDSVLIPELKRRSSYTLNYTWTPTAEGTYNITAYTSPVPDENVTANNVAMRRVYVSKYLYEGTVIYLDPSTSRPAVGDVFTVDVNIFNVTNLFGYDFKLYYDTTVLDGLNVTLTPDHFLTTETPSNLFIAKLEVMDDYNATHGRVWVAMTLLDPESPKSGSGTLAMISFKAASLGESALNLAKTKLAEKNGDAIAHSALDGLVEIVQATILGDVNYDGIVDIFDGVIIAVAYGSTPTDPKWNPDADLNNDQIIDLYDLITWGDNYGRKS